MEELWGVFREGVSLKVGFELWKPMASSWCLRCPLFHVLWIRYKLSASAPLACMLACCHTAHHNDHGLWYALEP